MHYSSITLGLIATASAIDIRFHINNRGCSGSALVCFNVNPGFCCYNGGNDRIGSVGYYGIPTDWNINARFSYDRTCPSGGGTNVVGRNFFCQNAVDSGDIGIPYGAINSATWVFNGRKRYARALDGEGAGNCQKADTFVREDGQMYDITGLDGEQLMELIALAENGTAAAEFPEAFRALEKSE